MYQSFALVGFMVMFGKDRTVTLNWERQLKTILIRFENLQEEKRKKTPFRLLFTILATEL